MTSSIWETPTSDAELVVDMRHAAIVYAKDNVPVFPLHTIRAGVCSCGDIACDDLGKHPVHVGGHNTATTDLDQVLDWWNAMPDANIGMPTGTASGLDVLDVDSRHDGETSLATLEERYGPPLVTAVALTGGGGRHLYFLHVPKVRNSAGRLGPGLDVRGEGGYVVLPPSLHVTGRRYRWR